MSSQETGCQQYRDNLAVSLWSANQTNQTGARRMLVQEQRTLPYIVSKQLHQHPNLFSNDEPQNHPDISENECDPFGHYMSYISNEFYRGLAPELKNIGGVGLSVGSDQGLDFFTMGNLDELYNIDIDPHTHVVTRNFLELGVRLKSVLERYPTTQEYIRMFEKDVFPITLNLLASPSARHTFHSSEIQWFREKGIEQKIHDYLQNKKKYYKRHSWIGTDNTLHHVLDAYQQGRIHIYQDDITGNIIPKLSQILVDKGQHVSLIYTSNARIRNKRDFLDILRTLPLTEASKLIYSMSNCGSDTVPIPKDSKNILHWKMFVLHPLNEQDWPHSHHYGATKETKKFKEIAPGCYKRT